MSKLDRFISQLAITDGPVLVATDFDGTLVPVVTRPDAAQLGADSRAVLERLAAIRRVRLAVVTGRSLVDVSSRLDGIDPIWISAEHGAVLRDPSRKSRASTSLVAPERIDTLRQRAEQIAALYKGALVESKEVGVALHYREVATASHEGISQMFRLVCAVHGADVLPGRFVLEGRFARSDKGVALARLLAELPGDAAFVYAGDDETDEPALSMAALSERGLGLYVASAERPSPSARVSGLLDGPREWLHLLGLLATTLEAQETRRAS